MLKKWLHKVLPKKHVKSLPEKEIIPLEQHGIHADMLSFAAEKIAKRLHEAGFQAYVVGGAVRDLLLGVEPKILILQPMPHRSKSVKYSAAAALSAAAFKSFM